jgi:hypothetical protein
MALTTTKISTAWAAAVIAAAAATGATVAGCAALAPRPLATAAAKREMAGPATQAGLSIVQGAKICDDLNTWVAGARGQSKPRFTVQMESDESKAGYSVLGTDLLELDSNLDNLNSGALKNSPPNYYPVTGLAALTHDCAGYGVGIKEP